MLNLVQIKLKAFLSNIDIVVGFENTKCVEYLVQIFEIFVANPPWLEKSKKAGEPKVLVTFSS